MPDTTVFLSPILHTKRNSGLLATFIMNGLLYAFLEPSPGWSMSRRLACQCRSIATRSTSSLANASIPPVHRPYTFHIGASWAGKPLGRQPKKRLTIPFAPDSVIGKWRDQTLARPKAVVSDDSGEDFFYIQAVSLSSSY